tara:strand:- start:36 stop:1760 length:1725 start_codon:yes stop_codon:yes gene_type:complete
VNVPDFKNYSLSELEDSLKHIDEISHPETTVRLKAEIQARRSSDGSISRVQEDNLVKYSRYNTPSGNWITLHWYGKLPLGFSYWANVFAISVAVLFLTKVFFNNLVDSDASVTVRGLTIITFYFLFTVITIWQLVGLFRSADKHPSRGGSIAWSLVAKAMVMVGVFRYCYDIAQTGIPFLLESGKIVISDTSLPPHFIRVMNNGTEIELLGGIEFGVSGELDQILKTNPDIKIIHLNSLGGRIAEAKKIAILIKKYGLTTYSKTKCLSACPIVFISGKEKLLGNNAELGFHSASIGSVSGSAVEEVNAELIKELNKAKISKWFITKVANTSAKKIWTPTHDELLKANVVDRVVDSDNYALSGITDWQNPVSLEAPLLKNELYKAMHDFDNQSYTILKDIIFEGVRTGLPLNITSRKVDEYVYANRLGYYLQNGNDKAVKQYLDSQVNQMSHLQENYPSKCASYLYPKMFDSSILDDLPQIMKPELKEQKSTAIVTLIKSLSTKNHILDGEERNQLVSSVLEKAIKKDGALAEVYSKPNNFIKEPTKLCKAALSFYGGIASLPEHKAAALMRSIY